MSDPRDTATSRDPSWSRAIPEPLTLAVALSSLVLLLAIARALSSGASIDESVQLVRTWADKGLWRLLAFGMQTCLMLTLGGVIADAPLVRRGLRAAVWWPRSPLALVAFVATGACTLGLINWTFGLIGGAVLAREAAGRCRAQGWTIDPALLAAAGYASMMIWHCGLSGSGPLKTSRDSDLIEVLGPDLAARVGAIPLASTMFSPMNLLVASGLLVLTPLAFVTMARRAGGQQASDREVEHRLEASVSGAHGSIDAPPASNPSSPTQDLHPISSSPTPTWEDRAFVTWVLAVPMALGAAAHFAALGPGGIDFDTLNLVLWIAALLLHQTPRRFTAAAERSIRDCAGVLFQFPIYAGIMAMLVASGLSTDLAGVASRAGAGGIAPATFVSAGLLNIFVPSGGGQWGIQGPVVLTAALDLGVAPGKLVMAFAYGDAWTNMLQPFWALPVLAITHTRASDLLRYTVPLMLAGGVWFVAVLALWPG